MLTFSRQNYTELWIRIVSNESLGILDTDYVEDYFGTDGQLTLHEVASGVRTPILMAEDLNASPLVPHDVFNGMIDLTSLPDGLYHIEGRVRDTIGNYRILSSFQTPDGGENLTLFEVMITPAEVVVRLPKEAQILEAFKAHTISALAVSGNLNISVQAVGIDFSVSMQDRAFDVAVTEVSNAIEGSIEETPQLEINVLEVFSI